MLCFIISLMCVKYLFIYIDIDGLEGMKPTFGITAVEGKDSQEKAAKVNLKLITLMVLNYSRNYDRNHYITLKYNGVEFMIEMLLRIHQNLL